jgi:hypothetical protein
MDWQANLTIDKDPDKKADWVFRWNDVTASGDSIASYVITVETGITLVSDSKTTADVTVWLSGGTPGQTYTVSCKIVTTAGREDEKSVRFRIKQQ